MIMKFMLNLLKIKEMGNTHRRLHYSVKWENTVPKIISEKNKKLR